MIGNTTTKLRSIGARAQGARRRLGRLLTNSSPPEPTVAALLEPGLARDIAACRPYTMASIERLVATSDAVEYVVRRGIPGALVECGVWRGGSTMAMLLALRRLGVNDRDVWLYDTFEGMTEPSSYDISPVDRAASETWDDAVADESKPWSEFFGQESFSLPQVRSVLLGTGYPEELLHFAVGPVQTTVPAMMPERVAVLRLDTDWYESTRHEMVHLYPLLSPGAVLIIDDYGHWEGARKAVDEYLNERGEVLLLQRTDYTGRMGVKPGA